MKMIVASNNLHKINEIQQILREYEILSMAEAGINIEIEENGHSFQENALIKARAISKMTGILTLSDDSGLEVEALNWQPGIYSARYSGVEGVEKDKANRVKLLAELENVPKEQRQARFCSAIALVYPNQEEIVTMGYVYGNIGFEEKGNNGFGYDNLFIVDHHEKTMAEMIDAEKNAISHRANALYKLKKILGEKQR